MPPQLFHKIFGLAFLLARCVQGNPVAIPPVPDFSRCSKAGLEEVFPPGSSSLTDNEMEDVILQLEHRISRLEGALRLEEKITTSGGKIFAASGKKADFHTAVQACKEAGGALATPRTAGENAAVRRLVRRHNAYAYLGIRESLIPGEFRSLGGAKLNYTHWHAREPSGKGEEQCVEMYTDGTWNDKKCNQNHLIVCQF